MLISRDIVGQFYPESAFPPFPCPTCFHNLTPLRDELRFVPTRQSSFLYDVGAIEPDGLQGYFHLQLGPEGVLRPEPVGLDRLRE